MSSGKSHDHLLKKLEQENARLRGDLLAIGRRVTHDLRTPLGSICISIELLKELLNDNAAAAGAIHSLNTSIDELGRLLKSLSIVAKATANPPPMEPVEMGEIVWNVVQQLERRTAQRGATVDVADSWPRILGNPGWLEFIWWNLLANSLQHGGPRIQLDWSKENELFLFGVRDSGGPIPPETQALLFQPFDSLHQTNSTRGLGLSIVQRLVNLQGGRCGCQAIADGGSRFHFTLPAAGS
ncbi:MAG: sensor histidine kinase [Limisphaerales bacterium]